MLVALDKENTRTEADVASKSLSYSCPACKNKVIPKQGEIKIWHFAHKYLGSCWWETESKDHIEAKLVLRDLFKPYYKSVELEYFAKDNIIDLLLDNKFAVEVQCSSISVDDFLTRTKKLNDKGYAVLWILAGDNINKLIKNIDIQDNRTRRFIYILHSKFYFGRFYFLGGNKIYAGYPYYRTKTLIKAIKSVPIDNLKLFHQEVLDKTITIARFYDKYEK